MGASATLSNVTGGRVRTVTPIEMVDIVNIVVNATIISSFYALIAIGFTLIFGVGGIFNFAHGAFITLGGFTAYVLSNVLGFPIEVGMLAAVLVAAVVGGVVYTGLVQHIEDRPMTTLILTLVIGFFVQHALRIFVTNTTITLPMEQTATPLQLAGRTDVLGVTLQHDLVFIFVSSWVIIAALFVIVGYTRRGKAIVAISMSERGARLVGIDSYRTNLLTWIVAAGLAGFAGVLVVAFQTGDWNMGNEPLIISFAIVVLGGLGSIKGSVVAAYVIGFVETFTVQVIDPQLTGVSALLILILVLLLMPEGIYGRESED